jgi:carbonic anhydrase
MTQIAALLAANEDYVAVHASHPPIDSPRPARRLAIVTCMDARIDVFAALGLKLGDAHVIRNAGGRVTDDVLRSLALSSHVLGVDTVAVMQHTGCGLAGVRDEELQALTGYDLGFLPIDDHAAALREDIELLAAQPYLAPIQVFGGFVFDVETGRIDDVVRWERPAA